MRCSCCDEPLTDYEATIRDVHGLPTDMCLECLSGLDEEIPGVFHSDRIDLRSEGFAIGEERYDEGSLHDENWD